MNGWVECKGERRNGRMNGWVEWKGERMNGRMEWMDGMERRTDEWTDESMFDSGMDGCSGEKRRTNLFWGLDVGGWANEKKKKTQKLEQVRKKLQTFNFELMWSLKLSFLSHL